MTISDARPPVATPMLSRLPSDLPVASVLAEAVAASRGGAVVVTAPPGSGKTMLVPAAILDDLPADLGVILLQPRRLAARAVARQIAALRGGQVGAEVGYRVRFDTCAGRDTRLVVETTGIMLRRLLGDVSLEGIGAVILDEFHERTIEMDLVLGMLVRLRQTVRPDLRIAVMSATLAAGPVANLLGDTTPCPVVSAAGRLFPVRISHLRHGDRRDLVDLVATTVDEALRATSGHVLVFLPGVGEIVQCERAIGPDVERRGHALLPLFGDMPPERQDRVLDDVGGRKVILATNVAETSLTIPGVTAVIDSGLARQLLVSPATGLPRLELVPISKAAAEQRAGRAGRTAAGSCWRLWDEASHHRRSDAEPPEVVRGDLAGPILQLMAFGERRDFPWLDPPGADALANARSLLERLGAIEGAGSAERLTPLGRDLVDLPAHPRLARLLLAGARHGVLREASIAAALLSERDPFRPARHAGTGPRDRRGVRSRSDVVDRVLALQAFHAGVAVDDADLELHAGAARNVLRVAERLYAVVDVPLAGRTADPAAGLMLALLEAFPDRLARLRPGANDRGTLVGGRGVRLEAGSRVRAEPLFLAIDIADSGGEASVRMASAVERAWLDIAPLAAANLRSTSELLFHPTRGQVEARLRTNWLDLVLEETPVPIADADAAAHLLAREAATRLERLLPAADTPAGAFRARARWLAAARPDLGLPAIDDAAIIRLLPGLCRGRRSFDELRAADWLAAYHEAVGHEIVAEVERLAPAQVDLSTGRRHRLAYQEAGPPVLAVRIQDLFGVRETPRVAGGTIPVVLHLLGPNHRPQQVTSDLAGFWSGAYQNIKKELRRRYPKHAWPDDPLAPRR